MAHGNFKGKDLSDHELRIQFERDFKLENYQFHPAIKAPVAV